MKNHRIKCRGFTPDGLPCRHTALKGWQFCSKHAKEIVVEEQPEDDKEYHIKNLEDILFNMQARMIMLRLHAHNHQVDKDMTFLLKSAVKVEKVLDAQKPKFYDPNPLVLIDTDGNTFRFLNGVLVDENNVPTGEKPPRIL